jgi:hypothetical protein
MSAPLEIVRGPYETWCIVGPRQINVMRKQPYVGRPVLEHFQKYAEAAKRLEELRAEALK